MHLREKGWPCETKDTKDTREGLMLKARNTTATMKHAAISPHSDGGRTEPQVPKAPRSEALMPRHLQGGRWPCASHRGTGLAPAPCHVQVLLLGSSHPAPINIHPTAHLSSPNTNPEPSARQVVRPEAIRTQQSMQGPHRAFMHEVSKMSCPTISCVSNCTDFICVTYKRVLCAN